MKRYFWIALALCLSMSVVDASAQSLLDKLGPAVKKEVENRVAKEIEKEVKKEAKKGEKAIEKEENFEAGNKQESQEQLHHS